MSIGMSEILEMAGQKYIKLLNRAEKLDVVLGVLLSTTPSTVEEWDKVIPIIQDARSNL